MSAVRLQGRNQTDVRRRISPPGHSLRFRRFQGTGLQALGLNDLVFFLGSRKKSNPRPALPITRVTEHRVPDARQLSTVSSALIPGYQSPGVVKLDSVHP